MASAQKEEVFKNHPNKSPDALKARGKIPPHDLDAEMAVLGSMMMNREVIDEVAAVIPDAEAFYLPAHRILYDRMREISEGEGPIDLIVVQDVLKRHKQFDLVGGQEYMIQLAESFSDWANAEHYARIVVEHWTRRRLIQFASGVADRAYDLLADDLGAECSRIVSEVDAIAASRVTSAVVRLDLLLGPAAAALHEPSKSSVPSGIPAFDDRLGGLVRPGLVVLAGRPSVGKTAVAVVALFAAASSKTPALLVSSEMDQISIAQRALCSLTGDTLPRLRHRASPADVQDTVAAALRAMGRAELYICDSADTLRRVVSVVRVAVRKHKIAVVAVDYLQLLRIEGKWGSRNEAVAHASLTLKNLVKELGVCLILLSQYNREAANCDARSPPTLDNLRDSGAIEQDADMVIALYPVDGFEWRRNDKPQLILDVQKNRNGPLVQTEAVFEKAHFRLRHGISDPGSAVRAESRAEQDEIPF